MYSKGLEGDVRAALKVLEGVAPEHLTAEERSQRSCLLETFVARKPPAIKVKEPFVAALIAVYRDYWTRVLLHELSEADGEAHLLKSLEGLLQTLPNPHAHQTLDDALEAVDAALQVRGFHAILGVTQPYYELMVWGTETTTTYQVELPDQTQPVKVVLLRDFAALGWSAFATCDHAFSGGWAKEDALYCVADSYDLKSEHFSVSYLAHEAQHFADYHRFPKLEQTELEYRAKLVELTKAQQTAHELVTDFASQTGDSRSAPHNFANLLVVKGLARALLGRDAPVSDAAAWRDVSVAELQHAARHLLDLNTKQLVDAGAQTVTRVLE